MDRQIALTIKDSLDAGSKRNLDRYCKQLRAEDNEVIFDDRALKVMLKYAKDPSVVQDVRQWCNLTNFNQSTKEYSQIVNQLERFAQEDYTSFRWNRNYQEAKALLIAQFRKANLKPLNYTRDQDLVDALPKKDTHSGWTYILTGRKRKGDNLEDIYNRFMIEVSRAKSEKSMNKPILIGTRTQCGNVFHEDGSKIYDEFGQPTKAKHKTRLVSMIDLHWILAELIWAKPLQKFMGEHVLWYAGGKNDDWISNRITHLRSKFSNWISLDYSKYDQSISSWLMEDCMEIKRAAFPNIGDGILWDITGRDSLYKVFIDGDGRIWVAKNGEPSGLMCTNMDDTIINKLMITTCMLAHGKKPEDFECLIMGDDNLIFVDGVDKKSICTYLRKNFGIECNETKSSQGNSRSDDPEFLSRFWTLSGPYRHPNILISKLLFPERFRDYDGKGFTPEIVFYSYVLAYRRGMEEAFDVKSFLNDHSYSITNEMLIKGREHLPGYLGYLYSYGLV